MRFFQMSPLQFLLLDEKHFLLLYLSLLKVILHCDLQLKLFSLQGLYFEAAWNNLQELQVQFANALYLLKQIRKRGI